MQNISFSHTTAQIRNRTKTVTRRLGWLKLKAGTLLCAVEKSQGLKSGESVVRLGIIRVVSVTREPLDAIADHPGDVGREGFPDWTAAEFIRFFKESFKLKPGQLVTRIEFVYAASSQIQPHK